MASAFGFRAASDETSPLARKSDPHPLTRESTDSPQSIPHVSRSALFSGWNDENARYTGHRIGKHNVLASRSNKLCGFGAIGEPVIARSRRLGLTTSNAYESDQEDKSCLTSADAPVSLSSFVNAKASSRRNILGDNAKEQRIVSAGSRSFSLGMAEALQSESDLIKPVQYSDSDLRILSAPGAAEGSAAISPLPNGSADDSLDSAGAFEVARLREELTSAKQALAHYRDEALRARLAGMVQLQAYALAQPSRGLTVPQLESSANELTGAHTLPLVHGKQDELRQSPENARHPASYTQPRNACSSASPLGRLVPKTVPLPIGSSRPRQNTKMPVATLPSKNDPHTAGRFIDSTYTAGPLRPLQPNMLPTFDTLADCDSDRLYFHNDSPPDQHLYPAAPTAEFGLPTEHMFPTSSLSPTASEFTGGIFGPDPWNQPPTRDPSINTWSRTRDFKLSSDPWNKTSYQQTGSEYSPRRQQKFSEASRHMSNQPYGHSVETQNMQKRQPHLHIPDSQAYIGREVSHNHSLRSNQPFNYSRLLEDDTAYNWTPMVHKIVMDNDQQASIFLQQKLKFGTAEQKQDMVEAIISQVYALMTNRFGNFLVQRCFDHGTATQVSMIADAIQGRVVELSMDPFGCHVVQKAFDSVTEDYRATMVRELLARIPETVMHRYACHVWQKLFELRWTGDPPQIMPTVNAALRGQWERVAQGETSSLVVQNIFENCLDADKRPVVEEILMHIDRISRGQFGNWCVQHICEHGAPMHRERAINHIIRMAADYSMDQYASKIIEKMLKVGGVDFLDRYLERLCEVQLGRPRVPLIDVAGDQYGNYLIQYIMDFTTPKHHGLIADHVRRHMVSLRGSKFGSRVAARCCEPEKQIRAGPPARAPLHRYSNLSTSNYYQAGGSFGNQYR